MAAALIRIDQAGHPTQVAGVAGRSRDDIVLGSPVQLLNVDDTGVRSHRWEILDQPSILAPDALSNPVAASPTFTPNTAGTYLIRLIVNEGRKGEVYRILVAVRDANGNRLPAAGETSEANWLDASGVPNPRGWQPDMNRSVATALSGGGGGWTEVYAIDFRDVFAALGAVNLNAAGSTFTYQGVQWETPSVARNGDAMQAAATSFGITANGLEVVGSTNSRIQPGTLTAQVIFAALEAIAANTETPFDADPSREYMLQAYVSAQNPAADHEHSAVFMFREANTQPISNGLPGAGALYRTSVGRMNASGAAGTLESVGGTSVSPPRLTILPSSFTTPEPDPDVVNLWYSNPAALQGGGGVYDSGFPLGEGMHYWATNRDSTDNEDDIIAHPRYGFFIGCGHCSENANNTYNAVIQQFRILQK